jgi:hypothetical protein
MGSSLQKSLISINATSEIFTGTFSEPDSKALSGLLGLRDPKINDWGFDSLAAAQFIEKQEAPKIEPAITAFSALNGNDNLFSAWTGEKTSTSSGLGSFLDGLMGQLRPLDEKAAKIFEQATVHFA